MDSINIVLFGTALWKWKVLSLVHNFYEYWLNDSWKAGFQFQKRNGLVIIHKVVSALFGEIVLIQFKILRITTHHLMHQKDSWKKRMLWWLKINNGLDCYAVSCIKSLWPWKYLQSLCLTWKSDLTPSFVRFLCKMLRGILSKGS